MLNRLKVTRGSDVVLPITLSQGEAPFDLTGYTARIFEKTENADFAPTVAITGAAAGQLAVSIDWQDALPTKSELRFRVQVQRADGTDLGLPEMTVVYE